MFRAILIVSALALTGCTAMMEEDAEVEEVAVEQTAAIETTDVVSTIAATNNLSTFASMIDSAGLADTLSGPGPFTVFAPTDAAFAALPEEALGRLLEPDNRERLRVLLAYHVLPGQVTASDVAGQQAAVNTAMGAPVRVDATDGIRVNSANVIAADVEAANGVIHIIDRVLVPQIEPQAEG